MSKIEAYKYLARLVADAYGDMIQLSSACGGKVYPDKIAEALRTVGYQTDSGGQDAIELGDGEPSCDLALPEYTSPVHRLFVENMKKAGYAVYHYNSRNFYSGPAVLNMMHSPVMAHAGMPCDYDDMGTYSVIYPK